LAWSIILLSIGLTSCLSVPKSEYPSDWAPPLRDDGGACPKVSGTYWNWPEQPALIKPESLLGGFSLATLLLENRLDFEPGYYDKFRLETTGDGTLRVDILDRQTEAVVLSKSLHVEKDLACERGAFVFGPFSYASGEAFLMMVPNVGWRDLELWGTADGDLVAVINDHAAAAIGVLLPVFGMERYWYRWLREKEAGGEQ
jgi:hypothetical protein